MKYNEISYHNNLTDIYSILGAYLNYSCSHWAFVLIIINYNYVKCENITIK